MNIVQKFVLAQADYDPKDANSVDAFVAAKEAALKAGYKVSPGDPKRAVLSATAKTVDPALKTPAKVTRDAKITDPKPQEGADDAKA